MPTAPVDDKGTVLYYEDTGAPSGSSDYITLVLIHGTCFHSAIYRPLIPFAGERNLRLLLLNLRDYPGSTPLSEEEIDGLRGPSVDVQDRTLRDRGLEIAAFCRWFIETEKIPPVRESVTPEGVRARVGGLSILSWSGGNCTTVAMFAHVDKIPEETRAVVRHPLTELYSVRSERNDYWTTAPAGLTALKSNPTAPVDVQVADLAVAVASYYPVFTFPDRIEPMPDYPTRQPLHLSADAVDPKYIPTTTKMPPEVLRSVTHPPVMAQNQHLLWSLSHAVYRENLRRALYDCRFDFAGGGGGAGEKAWPALPVHVVWCDMSVGDCLWASVVIHALYEEADPERRRRVEFHKLEGANHFVHWEEPERFVEFLASIV